MNPEDPNEPHLTPVGDAELEARIVAWVLGEASAFEAAELARLCEENPELRLFEQRIRAVHGLVAQDFHPLPGEDWRLPEEKRTRVTALFGDEVAAEKARQKRVNRYFTRRALLATAACITVAAVSWKIAFPQGHKEGKVAMSIAPEPDFMPAGGGGDDEFAGAKRENTRAEAPKASRALAAAEDMQEQAQVERKSKLSAPARVTEEVRYKIDESEMRGDEAKSRDGERGLALRDEPSVGEMPPPAPASAPAPAVEDSIVTGGLRSGSGVIDRENIDSLVSRAQASDDDRKDSLGLAEGVGDGRGGRFSRAASGSGGAGGGGGTGEGLGRGSGGGIGSGHGAASGPVAPPLNAPAIASQPQSAAKSEKGQELLLKKQMMGEAADLAAGNEATRSKAALSDGSDLAFRARSFGREAGEHFSDSDAPADAKMPAGPGQPLAAKDAQLSEAQNDLKADYYRDAYDETRSEALSQKDQSWGMKAPEAEALKPEGQVTDLLGAVRREDPNLPEPQFDGFAKRAEAESAGGMTSYNGVALQGLQDKRFSLYSRFRAVDGDGSPDDATVMATGRQRGMDTFFGGFNLGDQGGPATESSHRILVGAEYEVRDLPPGGSDFFNFDGRPQHLAILGGREFLVPDNTAGQAYSWDKPLYAQANADAGLPGEMPALSTLNPVPPPADAPAEPAIVEELQKPVIEPLKEVSAADEAFSTFSLHVSDVSFRLAKAALDRGEQPAPESIREEEFYNAVDYGDAPAGDQPVACVVEESAHPYRPQRELVRIGVRTGSSGRSQSTPLHLVLLLDSSGSMERDDRHTGLLNAVKELSTLLKDGDTITVVGFSRTPRLLVDRLSGKDAAKLNEIVRNSPVEGGTDLAQGLKLSAELATRQFSPDAQNRVVLFTDGAANLGDADPKSLADLVVKMRQQHIAFDAAGFGADGLNDKMLEQLTRDGDGRYYVVNRPEDADGGFAHQLAGAFRPAAENVKVQVRFNPSRVGKYRLAGFAEHRLQKEDFHNDAVDAAEMAAEEAGNALYDVETLPQGEGEIGEVSVRFRDASNGQMVERTWTIPYDPATPAFDRAKPSMQLAGLALMAAEKLKGGAGAGAIDFGQFANPLAVVRQAYGQNTSTSQLLEMIGKLR